MTKHEKILRALQIPHLSYVNYRDLCFENWCTVFSCRFSLPRRVLVTNQKLYQWYCTQWLIVVETTFYSDHKDYLESGVQDAIVFRELFSEYPLKLQQYYPSVLIKTIKQETT